MTAVRLPQTASTMRLTSLASACTVFLSAFLLFQVQPLLSKAILPWFGGTPAVWTTCMLCFQVLLFAGYAYAHLLSKVALPKQVGAHVALLVAAAILLPILPTSEWKPDGDGSPTLQIIVLLAAHVGLPFFALSATGPLLQSWFHRACPGASPWRLYALSNIGSLLALLSYPFIVEPWLTLTTQGSTWAVGFVCFAALCAVCGALTWKRARPDEATESTDNETPAADPIKRERWLWFLLATAASVLLLAITNQVCLDVAAVPFLWIVPLSLYLLSFVLTFDSSRWYSRRCFVPAFAVTTAAAALILAKGSGVAIAVQVLVYFAGLFFGAMVCHGELVKLKPHPKFLTSFYLTISAGGAAGGIFVAVLAPLIFPEYLELHCALWGASVLAAYVVLRDFQPRSIQQAGIVNAVTLAALLWLTVLLGGHAVKRFKDTRAVARNFYGVLRVKETEADNAGRHQVQLMHGRIVHGLQFVHDSLRNEPTSYYGRNSGVGLALDNRPATPQRVGVVGLGAGTLAAYARHGDSYRFYEINDDVIHMAREHFTYLQDTPAEVELELGDARLSLEREPDQQFDVLVLDAFSGDAIPVHLLTREAWSHYARHVKPDGVLAVHVSNLHFDLRPVIDALADEYQQHRVTIISPGEFDKGTLSCIWVLLSRGSDALDAPSKSTDAIPPQPERKLWTDQFSNLFEILR